MAIVKGLFGALGSLNISLASLANHQAWQSDAVDNSTNMFLDVQLIATIVMPAGTPAGAQVVNLYAFCSIDGNTFDDPAGSGNAAITLGAIPNMVLVASINIPSGGKTYYRHISSLATKLGGVLPLKWGLVIENQSGLTLATGSGLQYRGLNAQSV